MLTQADIDYMRRTADEYDALLKRWTAAPAYSQEVANLHATFKARAGDVGRMVENGLFRRLLDTLDAGVMAAPTGALRYVDAPKALQDALIAYHARPCDDEAGAVVRAVLDAYGVQGTLEGQQ